MLPRSPSRARDEGGGEVGFCIHPAFSTAWCRVPAPLDCLRGRPIERREVTHPEPHPTGSHPVYKFLDAQLISARQESRQQLTRAASFQLFSWSNLGAILSLKRIEGKNCWSVLGLYCLDVLCRLICSVVRRMRRPIAACSCRAIGLL